MNGLETLISRRQRWQLCDAVAADEKVAQLADRCGRPWQLVGDALFGVV
jgi:hypothetical protein